MDPPYVVWIIIGGSLAAMAFFVAFLSELTEPTASGPRSTARSMSRLLGYSRSAALEESVHSMRSIEFFVHRPDASDREIVGDIAHKIYADVEDHRPLFRGSSRPRGWWTLATEFRQRIVTAFKTDMLVVASDSSRVWWRDLDQVGSNRNAYATMLQRWSEISRGAFNPENIQESWGKPGESIFVSFSLNGGEHLFIHLTSYDDLLDTVGMRAFVNPLIEQTGIQFEIVDLHHTPNIVIALSSGEREQLERERGWRFAELPALVI